MVSVSKMNSTVPALKYPTALAAYTAASPISFLIYDEMLDGASSITF